MDAVASTSGHGRWHSVTGTTERIQAAGSNSNIYHPLKILKGLPVFEIDHIVKHQYKKHPRTKKSRMEFLIHWKDQPTAAESWEPLHSLRATAKDALRDYYTTQGWKIPKYMTTTDDITEEEVHAMEEIWSRQGDQLDDWQQLSRDVGLLLEEGITMEDHWLGAGREGCDVGIGSESRYKGANEPLWLGR
ncbi:hypothetical protein BJ508DRAFT_333936 [Ascobolus immersus RN42]|uniref:Chromo domain-containing protein n=1 Tax=Ascobolus immersus RN42 TaxID=1160509 RepID=A0A3N4HM92_ASCIM|nr:hypothetical protein BJ508DRAFT_333936 [Ascobolus immersus RN42]